VVALVLAFSPAAATATPPTIGGSATTTSGAAPLRVVFTATGDAASLGLRRRRRAIHGYPTVPFYPGSHGCVRVPLWLAPRIYSYDPPGSTIYIY
jgi:hypothetical protein